MIEDNNDNSYCVTADAYGDFLHSVHTMVKHCVICHNVEAVPGVSVHTFLIDAVRQRLWVQFVENLMIHVNRTSKSCSRHFIPGVHFLQGGIRPRLTRTAMPSIVVGAPPVPDRELPIHSEIDNADANGGTEIVAVEVVEVQVESINMEVVQMDQVLMDDVEVVPGQVKMVAPNNNEEMQLEIDFLLRI
ncbi:uncharacterized protein LOC100160923 isoform X3 [Acyrthosiphon pisum]|uniref:THAP-type domain-containing protein n=1 Tax=Acyrthosiphon pisum TaxID=7029 RepID=A0A8R2H2T3_ACYPI|nr:uncharacterized protein LOC100160923 isoform X3 [Acyrthosiphon pisum]|eukprot:XP_016656861.1 PREDICTED: uncharacterized protein LOC100160923 isoform X4 [Acyrthosiphon pisum]